MCAKAKVGLSLAKSSSATKNGASLGSEGLNTISMLRQSTETLGGREGRESGTPWARASHIYLYIKDGRKVGLD
jgi:hypothetical protein